MSVVTHSSWADRPTITWSPSTTSRNSARGSWSLRTTGGLAWKCSNVNQNFVINSLIVNARWRAMWKTAMKARFVKFVVQFFLPRSSLVLILKHNIQKKSKEVSWNFVPTAVRMYQRSQWQVICFTNTRRTSRRRSLNISVRPVTTSVGASINWTTTTGVILGRSQKFARIVAKLSDRSEPETTTRDFTPMRGLTAVTTVGRALSSEQVWPPTSRRDIRTSCFRINDGHSWKYTFLSTKLQRH